MSDILGSNEVVGDTMNMIQPLFGDGGVGDGDLGGRDSDAKTGEPPGDPKAVVIGGPDTTVIYK